MQYRTTVLACALVLFPALLCRAADRNALPNTPTVSELNKLIDATQDPTLKKALHDNESAIIEAAQEMPHLDAVVRAVEAAHGKVEKINKTPEALTKAYGSEQAHFDTIRLVDLSIPNAGPHDARKEDPFDAAFFDHLGHLSALESLYIIQTKAGDDWIAPIGNLKNLKSLRFVNNGKLTDAGLEKLAGLNQMESFGYIGTQMKGHAFAKFEGWTNLKQCSFRGSAIDDEGLKLLCEKFPNLESLSLAHAKFTDAAAPALAKLTKMKGLELGTHNATTASLSHLAALPLEYLQLGDGLDAPACIPIISKLPALKRLTLTDGKTLTDADLKQIAGMKQLENLELNNLELSDERVPQLQSLAFLKALRLVKRPQAYPAEMQAKIKSLLPTTAVKFD